MSALDAGFAAYAVGMAPMVEFVDLGDGAASAVLGVLRPWMSGTYLNFAQ